MNIDELLTKAEKILDDYENLSGLPEYKIFDNKQVNRYFNMTFEELNSMSAIECAEAAYLLAQYSFYLQRMFNRESAKNRWGQDQITKLVCDKLDNYSTYTKYENKIALIAKENKSVERLQSIINYTNQVMERLNFLSTSVKNMSEIMSHIQKAKAFQNRASHYEY